MLSYAPFLGAQLLATPASGSAVADFIVGLFLSRIPILLFQAVQAALLPKLAALVSAGQTTSSAAACATSLLVVSGIGVVGVVGGATLGPFVGHILFGAKFELGNLDLALLAAGSGLFILALTLSQGLIALDALRTGAGRRGWSAWSRSSWRRWCRRPTCSPGWRSARSSAPGRPRLTMA